MLRLSLIVMILTMLVFGCDNETKKNDNDSENTDEMTDVEISDELSDDLSDEILTESDIETDDADADADADELQQLQTGGIALFRDPDDKYNPQPDNIILGNGGFFGYSLSKLNENYWAVGAIHESVPPYDFEKATGVLYIFSAPSLKEVSGITLDMAHRLTHPELKINVGFGFAVTKTCDINNDGFEDLAVSSHLASHGDLYAAGEIVVFYGTEKTGGWNIENTSISRVSDGLIQKADSMSQSLVCGDIDGDGFDDILAGGQNAGPELASGGSAGMVAFFKGSSEGLSKNETWTLVPEVEEKAQYFGSSMILEDVNGDDKEDLIVSGWGLKDTAESDNTGGVYVYHGGTDWQSGPALKVFGTKNSSQLGSVIKLVKVGDETLLGVIAPKEGTNGTIHFYDPSTMTEKFTVKVPGTLNMGSNGGFTDFDTISKKEGTKTTTTLVAGGKYFKDGGRILCAKITPESAEELKECVSQPEITSGGFGSSVKNIGSVDVTDEDELIVGMPEYIHEF